MKKLILVTMVLISAKSFAAIDCASLFGSGNTSRGELSVFNQSAISDKYGNYYLNGKIKQPQVLQEAFLGVINGRMSTSAFDQFVEAQHEKKSITLNVLVSKAEWADLHLSSPKFFPQLTPLEMVKEFSDAENVSFKIEKETDQHYIISFKSKDQTTLDGLAKLGQVTFAAYVFTNGNPTNMLMRVSQAVFNELIEYTRKRLNNESMNYRYALIQRVLTGHMSLDAAKALVDFNGKPVLLEYHVSKHTMKNMSSKYFKGTKDEIQEIFEHVKFENEYLGENQDVITYRIKIASEKDLELLNTLITSLFEPTLTLAE